MSAQGRLAAALPTEIETAFRCTTGGTLVAGQMVDTVVTFDPARAARDILAADPTLAQAIEDGTELALLREALPEGWEMALFSYPDEHAVMVYDHGKRYLRCAGLTVAAAARACREELEARKGPEGGA